MKKIRINEKQLSRIVGESVRRLLESQGGGYEEIKQAYDLLGSVVNGSTFIPFASPAPSSTEDVVRDSVVAAYENLGNALEACMSLGYANNMD